MRTVLGVSNVSFGLPLREIVNATFLAAAFSAGLDMPILNPLSVRYREIVDTWRVLCGGKTSRRRGLHFRIREQKACRPWPASWKRRRCRKRLGACARSGRRLRRCGRFRIAPFRGHGPQGQHARRF